jgi:hypothetical protein
MSDPGNEERVMRAIVKLVAGRFAAEFGDGRGCQRGVPDVGIMPENTPMCWLGEGETQELPDERFTWSKASIVFAVVVKPLQADVSDAASLGESAIWTKVNAAKEILRSLLFQANTPPAEGAIPYQILVRGPFRRFIGESGEGWLDFPAMVYFANSEGA